MPADERFIVRAFRDGDETSILDLFARSFHQPRTPEHFQWKYQHNPFGNEHISVSFDEAGSLIGHYSGYPVPFYDDGRSIIGHQIGDTMTDRAVRQIGRGPTSVLGRTALHFYENFCESAVAFNYGFNVANIQKFSLRFLRSDRVEPVPYRVRDLVAGPVRRMTRWKRWPRGYQIELVGSVGDEFDEFFTRVAPTYRFLIRRDARYLRWRYLQCPGAPYFLVAIRKWRRLVGWSVFRVRESRLAWGDALFDSRHADAVNVLLRTVAPAYPVDRIEAWFPIRPPWFDGVLRRLGFESRPEPQELSLMCVPFVMAEATSHMRSALYYTMGDSDLF